MRIYLLGYMGCGKSTVGKKLATKLNLKFIDLDDYLVAKHGKSIAEMFEEVGEDGFRMRERDAVREVAETMDNIMVSTGGGAPCFYDNMSVMRQSGVTIYLKMTPEALASRLVKARRSRPLLKDKTEEELISFVAQMLEKREPFYEQARIVVSALSVDVAGLVNRIYHVLK